MATEIVVPRLGWSMDEGVFAEWLKHDGERVSQGEPLFVLESDKAAQEIESFDAGILRIPPDAPAPGETVAVGRLLGYLVAQGERAPFDAATLETATPQPHAGAAQLPQPQTVTTTAPPATMPREPHPARRVAVTPRARRVARELGVDWTSVAGTGRNGRIRERDVRAAQSARFTSGPAREHAPQPGRLIAITPMRRTIAERMLAGVHQAAPVTLTTKVDATNLVKFREQFQAAASTVGFVPSYTDLIVKLVAAALPRHPLLRAQWRDEGMLVSEEIHIAFAVDTQAGLLAPVIRDVPTKSLRQVTAEARELVEAARHGRLTADQLQGGTFTVTNLGGCDIDSFTPILNLPQSAILGVGRIVREPAVVDNQIVPRDMLTLSLTFDHCVVDGAPAARFLQTLRQAIEHAAAWLAD